MEGQATEAIEQKQGTRPLNVTCRSHPGKQNPLFSVEGFGVWWVFI